jgi:hypothetical protein
VDNEFRVCTYFVPVCLRCSSDYFFISLVNVLLQMFFLAVSTRRPNIYSEAFLR